MLFTSEFKNFISENAESTDALIVSGSNQDIKLNFATTNITKQSKQLCTQFFDFIWQAYNAKETYWILERQYNNTTYYSGIMLDLDAYRLNTDRMITESVAKDCVTIIVNLLHEYLNIPLETETYALVLLNDNLSKHDNKYKEGIHILLPGIKITRAAKILIYKKLQEPITEIFKDLDFISDTVVDQESSSVPTQIYGTIRKGKTEAHKLKYAYKIKFGANRNSIIKISDGKDIMSNCYNYTREFSIHYDGDIIKKNNYDIKQEKEIELPKCNIIYQDIESEYSSVKTQCKNLTLSSYKAYEVYEYINLLNIHRGRGGQVNDWFKILKIILSINEKYLPFCRYFSIKSDEVSWAKSGEILLLQILQQVREQVSLSKLTEEEFSQKALSQLIYLVKQDNPAEFAKLKTKTFEGQLQRILNSDMVINQLLIARIICNILSYKVAYITLTSKNNNKGYWLEYIDEEKSASSGEYKPFIHKYLKQAECPRIIYDFIQNDLHNALQKFYYEIKTLFENKPSNPESKDNDKKKYSKFLDKISKAINMCGTSNQIDAIIKLCTRGGLINNNLYYQLDLTDNIIGVGDGLLVFEDKKVKFINTISEYKISRTTETLFNINDIDLIPAKLLVYKVLEEIIPNKLKLEALLMHLSLCLVGNSANRYFNIFYSGGASGKSLIMHLMENTLGLISSCKYGAESGYGYSETINSDVFLVSKTESNPNGPDTQLINLEHARIVHAPEGKSGIIKTEIIKKMRDGLSIRGLYEKSRSIVYKGLIIYVTNNTPRFLNYNYALERRFLYVYFGTRFTYNPRPNTNERKNNPEYIEHAKHNKMWASAFLHILVENWEKLQTKYKGNIEKCYEISGLLRETLDYLSTQNLMLQYKAIHVKITGNTNDSIEIIDFCRKYSLWYKNKLNINREISPEDFRAEAMENFPDQVQIREHATYFVGMLIIE